MSGSISSCESVNMITAKGKKKRVSSEATEKLPRCLDLNKLPLPDSSCSGSASVNNYNARGVVEPNENRRSRPLLDLNQPSLPDLNELPPYDSSDDEHHNKLPRFVHQGPSTVAHNKNKK